MSRTEIVLAQPVRTAIGAFNDTPATVLGAAVMWNVIQAGNRMNPARQAAIGGGLPVSVPALTVSRVCGSPGSHPRGTASLGRGGRHRRRW